MKMKTKKRKEPLWEKCFYTIILLMNTILSLVLFLKKRETLRAVREAESTKLLMEIKNKELKLLESNPTE